MKATIVAVLAFTALSSAHAQTVYRCGNAYSQAPCAGAKSVEVSDARTAVQQAEGRRVADAERRLAADLRRERLADERALRPAAAASLSAHPAPALALSGPERHHKRRSASVRPQPDRDFIAYDPSSRPRRGRARSAS